MGENRKIYAALLGAGTVGSGVYKLAGMQEEDICLKTGAQLEIKKILVRNPGKVREGIPQELFTDSWQEILEDPEIQIVIEVMGGIEPARTYVEEAMKAGKQVVTANKDLLADMGIRCLRSPRRINATYNSRRQWQEPFPLSGLCVRAWREVN